MGLNCLIIEQRTWDLSLQQHLSRTFAIVAAQACLASIHSPHLTNEKNLITTIFRTIPVPYHLPADLEEYSQLRLSSWEAHIYSRPSPQA